MSPTPVKLQRYKLHGLTSDQFANELNDAWHSLQQKARDDGAFQAELRAQGIDPGDLAGRQRTDFVRVEQKTSGFGWEEILIEFIVGVAVAIVEKYLLPELKRGKNREAIEPMD